MSAGTVPSSSAIGLPEAIVDVTDARPGSGDGFEDLLRLPGRLRRARSGLAFVYEALDVVAARFGLRDAVVVVDDTPVGRQAFRLRRHETDPKAQRWVHDMLRRPAGLHTRPAVVDRATADYVTELVATALSMDLLGHDASHDALTGLLNRRSYDRAVDDAVARNRRYGWPFALVLIDLDKFKVINDAHGHAAGDEALRALGVELRAVLRSGDVAARLGGDEFALIILNADSPESLDPLMSRLRAALARGVGGAKLQFSAGVAGFPGDADDIVALQRMADERLYADKAERIPASGSVS